MQGAFLPIWSVGIWVLHCALMMAMTPLYLSLLRTLTSKGEKGFFTPLGYHWANLARCFSSRYQLNMPIDSRGLLGAGSLALNVVALMVVPSFTTSMLSAGASSVIVIFILLLGARIMRVSALLILPDGHARLTAQRHFRAMVYGTSLLVLWLVCLWINARTFCLDQIIIQTKRAGLGSDFWAVQLVLGGILCCLTPLFCSPLKDRGKNNFSSVTSYFFGPVKGCFILSEGMGSLIWLTLIYDIAYPFWIVTPQIEAVFLTVGISFLALIGYVLRVVLICGVAAFMTPLFSLWYGRTVAYTPFALFLLGVVFLLVWVH